MNLAMWVEPQDLLTRARAGNDAALGQLLERYALYLSLLARAQIGRRLQGKTDPADLVQDTFLAAQFNFAKFRGTTETEFLAWLREILVMKLAGLARRYLGTKARNVRLERELQVELDHTSQVLDAGLIAPHSSPSQQVVRQEQGVRLADALAGLPEDYREVLILRHFEELPFAEVAARMVRSQDSVEKLWLRGLAQLKRSMGGSP